MDYFNYAKDRLYAEGCSVWELAEKNQTPFYLYSRATIVRHCQKFLEAFSSYETMACFAVKANSNLSILRLMFEAGMGADIVSLGELERALLAGVDPQKIVFSGVGKRDEELERALASGIYAFNVESSFELHRLNMIAARLQKVAPVALRINPDVDAKTHPKIATGLYSTKFGIEQKEALSLLAQIKDLQHIEVKGLACHIGSQITDLNPLSEAAASMVRFATEVKALGHRISFLNMGGGLGIRYGNEVPPTLDAYAQALLKEVSGTGLRLLLEPGRVVAGNTGILVTRVLGVKKTPRKNFIVVDASMTELVRPAFYHAYHDISFAQQSSSNEETMIFDIVGPVCESSDVLGEDRQLRLPNVGEIMVIRGAGAYGAVMASNYNSRPRPAEILVEGNEWKIIRSREKLSQLWELEV